MARDVGLIRRGLSSDGIRGNDTVKTPSSIVALIESIYNQRAAARGQRSVYDAKTGASMTHRYVGGKHKGPRERPSPPLPQNIPITLVEERSNFPRYRQPVVVHVDRDLVSRDTRKFKCRRNQIHHRILEHVHSTVTKRSQERSSSGLGTDNSPRPEHTTLPGGLNDVMVRIGIAMYCVVVVV